MSRISETDETRRRLLIAMLGLGTLASVPGYAAQYSRLPAKLPAGQFIYRLFGDVQINGIAVTLKTQIKAGDTITTGARSFVIFVFGEDAFILRSNSEMVVRPDTGMVQPEAQPKEKQEVNKRLVMSALPMAYSLTRGKALSVMASRQTRISTPTAVIGIRGTGVYVEAEPDEAYVCVCYGSTEIEHAADPDVRETVITKQHDAPKYVTGGANPRIMPAPFKNHDDEELLLIETLVGRSTPYFVPGGVSRSQISYF